MASVLYSSGKLIQPRTTLLRSLCHFQALNYISSFQESPSLILPASQHLLQPSNHVPSFWNPNLPRSFCTRSSSLTGEDGLAAIDYRSLMQEDEYQKLADSTLHDLQDKLEEFGDSLDVDGYDVDYANEVLSIKLGRLGTYVLNKQTPNRQIWMSSPLRKARRLLCLEYVNISILRITANIPSAREVNNITDGPSRYDWDQNAQAWIYRRTKANLHKVLESELEQLFGNPVSLS